MKKEDLVGLWKIQREMVSLEGAVLGRMWGRGFFDLYEGNQILYQEQLFHETKEKKLLFATKFYRYHFTPTSIDIYFYREEEGRLFMSLPLGQEVLEGKTKCKKDAYSLQWEWKGADTFNTQYTIRGPKKSLRIESEFIR